ncbi:MAG: undecaprenyl/decaprenyl-phosphate alpha-N-acetylglucosaminyl 1-phosphate transferase [Bacteroidaceae bacterium]|nr:undecaprenyl/decaprenyl-phosphate alpha-N-acetylglucosaminyl 1-phosphate transferase [Bacteroidaceae bacterium]
MLVLPWLLRLSKKRGLYDIPNERKVHSNKIPRIGGMIFFPSVAVAVIVLSFMENVFSESPDMVRISTVIVMAGVSLVYFIGVIDDIFGLEAKFKFVVQMIAAAVMPACGMYIDNLHGLFGIHELPIFFAWGITIFVIMLVVNAMNLIDGIDGLSSSLAVVALISFTVLYAHIGAYGCGLISVALLASVLVFMRYNIFGDENKNTKVFMGDAGSLILGYTFAVLFIRYATHTYVASPSAMSLSFSLLTVPVLDLVRVAFVRLFQGKSIFAADKQHIHHICLDAGMTMRRAVVVIVALQLTIIGVTAAMSHHGVNINLMLVVDVLIFASAIIILKNFRQRRKRRL